jgi:tripartite-type tricarboxylate transporter receptor subunit TctC
MGDTFRSLNVGRRTMTRNFLKKAVACVLRAAVVGWMAAASAQAYPDRPISLKVAFPAGGPADASFRAANVVLERQLGPPEPTDRSL